MAPFNSSRVRGQAGENGGDPSVGAVPRDFVVEVDDRAKFSTRKPCTFRHNYHDHPLMQLDRLEALAKSLSEISKCRFMAPGATVSSPFDHKGETPDGRSLDDVFQSIEEPGSWIALYNVESDPTYRRFLWDVMESFDHLVRPQESVYEMRGFIFISAPPSVTPYHIDREHNFWMQIKGRKTISVWDRSDRKVVAAADVEEFIVHGSLGRIRLTDEIRARSRDFDCGPGDGVYFPSTTPHMTTSDARWVEPGNGVTISTGIVFYTDATRREAYVHAFNRLLRKRGLNPRFPGESSLLDRLKYPFGRSVIELRRRFRGYSPTPSF